MLSDRRRILALALESLENKGKQIDQEIADLTRELRGAGAKTTSLPAKAAPGRKQSRFSREEKLRRSERMKVYWENWRKKKSRPK